MIVARHQKDVLGLEIAVHDAHRVGTHQRARHLRHDVVGLAQVEAAFAIEPGTEVLALQVLHHDERHVLPQPVIEHVYDVGRADLRSGARFALEPNPHLFVADLVRIDQLDRARAVE